MSFALPGWVDCSGTTRVALHDRPDGIETVLAQRPVLNVAIVDGLKLFPSRKLSTETSDMILHPTGSFEI